MKGYYYLHTNGSMIYKLKQVVDADPAYFDSPFVKKVWAFDSEDRGDAWKIVLEGFALGGNRAKLKKMAKGWGLTLEDCMQFMMRKEPGDLMQWGLKIFVEVVLDMDMDVFWEKMASNYSKG